MALSHATNTRTALANAVKNGVDQGATGGLINIYNAGKALLLATLTCTKPCGTVSGAILTFSTITRDNVADNTGTAAVFDVCDSTNAIVFSGTCSTVAAGTGDMQFPTVDFVAGQAIEVSSFVYTASL